MRKADAVILTLLVIAGVAIRFYLLRFHDVISADGTAYVGAARALGRGNVGPLSTYGLYPALIWLFSLPGFDPEATGRVMSVLFGGLLAVPVYLLGRELFSRSTALAACIALLAWPSLLNWSCEVMTQATYTFFTLAGFYGVWKTVKSRSAGWGAAAGTLLGLAFLTRPEGLLLALAVPLPLLWGERRTVRTLMRPLAAYAAASAALFGMNMVLLHQATGSWELSAKTSSALTDALSGYLQIPDLNYIPGMKSAGYLDIIRDYPGFVWSNSRNNLVDLWHSFAPRLLWVLALAGLCARRIDTAIGGSRLFLLATFSPLLVIIVFYYIGPEYTQPYIPVFLLLAAEGAVRLERIAAEKLKALPDRIRKPWSAHTPATLAASAVLAVTLLIGQIPAGTAGAYRPSDDDGRRDQKNIGLLLKQYLPPGKIMTRWARIAYYADRDWVSIPQADFDTIIRTAHKNGARYLIVDGGLPDIRPDLAILASGLDPEGPTHSLRIFDNGMANDAEFRLYLSYLSPSSMGVKVFELR